MSFDDFIRKYDGKGIDFDSAFSTQCVDLYRQYVKEVLGVPQSPPVPGAKDIWDTYLPDYFKRIENTPHGVPEKGDIVIWGTGLGKWGHVAVFIEGDANRFTSFDQNYPVGSLCHRQDHTYKGVLGWLKPIQKQENMPKWLETLLRENNQDPNGNWEGWFREVLGKAKDYDTKYQDTLKALSEAEARAGDTAQANALLVQQKAKLEGEVQNLQESLTEARNKESEASWKAEKAEIELKRYQEENDQLKTKNEDLRNRIKELTQTKLESVSLWEFILFKLRR